jgi:hypothetical protein
MNTPPSRRCDDDGLGGDGGERPDAVAIIEDAAEEHSTINTRPRLVVSGVVMLGVAVGLFLGAYKLGRGALELEREARALRPSVARDSHERKVGGWLWTGAAACTAAGGLLGTGGAVSLRKAAVG